MWLVKRKWRLWQLSSAEPAWKWDSQRSWPEAFFSQPLAFRANKKNKTRSSLCRKICQERIKESLCEQATTWKVFPTDFFSSMEKTLSNVLPSCAPFKRQNLRLHFVYSETKLTKVYFYCFSGMTLQDYLLLFPFVRALDFHSYLPR